MSNIEFPLFTLLLDITRSIAVVVKELFLGVFNYPKPFLVLPFLPFFLFDRFGQLVFLYHVVVEGTCYPEFISIVFLVFLSELLAVALTILLYPALVFLYVLGVELQPHYFSVVEVFFEFADDLHVCRVPRIKVLPNFRYEGFKVEVLNQVRLELLLCPLQHVRV